MELYGAIDLHSNNNVTVLIDERSGCVSETDAQRFALMIQQLSAYRESLQGIVVESTYNWYWLVDGLMDQGHESIWPTPQPSNSTKDSNTPTTHQMRTGWRTCYGWESYPKDTFIQNNNDPYATFCASVGRWCGKEPPTS